MDGYQNMPIEEMVRIEDKVDLSNCPIPNRSYKILYYQALKNSSWR
jgi:hypothetical protein